MLTERIMPTQAHADDIKKLPEIMYILECRDWVMGVDTYQKKRTFPLYSKNRYRKFEDLRNSSEELNSNIKDVEEMRKKEINLQHQRIVNFK